MAHRADAVTIGIGVDLVDLERFAAVIDRQTSFLDRVFTPDERSYCDRAKAASVRCERYAARFAAKEAVMKALGCGLGAFGFHDVAVARDDDSGEPALVVTGKAAVLAEERGVRRWFLSISHSHAAAVAFVVAD